MKPPIRLLAILATAGLAATAQAEDPKVPAALKGKLVELKGGEVVDGEISAGLEYYVIYGSASW